MREIRDRTRDLKRNCMLIFNFSVYTIPPSKQLPYSKKIT